jgi:electron transport complex protein RnfE
MPILKEFTKGIFKENPTFRLLIGICPPLAITTQAINGLGMGVCIIFVLVLSNLMISCLRNIIPDKVRIPIFIVIIATFVTITDMAMAAFSPKLYKALGIFIPLIVVNCIILGRAEAFASKNPVLSSVADGLGMGLGATLSLTILGIIREILGAGTLFGTAILPDLQPIIMMILPPGGFILLGLILGAINRFSSKI